ncbi:MAG: hypothetical protein CMP83_08400 [Gammaproteobacteria bacterium]|nr:hypothetical protein [Gammaproteobacteria bacterium]
MLYGDVSKTLNGLAFFDTELKIVFKREPQHPDGEWLVVDVSGSMRHHTNVLKMSFSAYMAIFGCVGQYHLPTLGGGTAIIASWAKLAQIVGAGGKVTFLTDCYDMAHRNKTREVPIRITEDGTIIHSDLETYAEMMARRPVEPSAPVHAEGTSLEDIQAAEQAYDTLHDAWFDDLLRHSAEWESKWFDVCLQHLQMGGVNVSLIGIGSEIQRVIAEAIKNVDVRVNLAWLPSDATPEQVTNVCVATHRRAPRPALGNGDNAAASTATVITVDAPEAQPAAVQLVENALTTVISAAERTRIGDSVTADTLKDLIISMEGQKSMQDDSYRDVNKPLARTAILWFISMAQPGVKIAGALLGGSRGSLFQNPEGGTGKTTWHRYLNASLSVLTGLGLFTSDKKAASRIKVGAGEASLYFSFHDAPHYTLKMAVDKDVVDALRADTEFAPPESALTKTAKGNSTASKYEEAMTAAGSSSGSPTAGGSSSRSPTAGGSSSGSPTMVGNGNGHKRRRSPDDAPDDSQAA